MTLGARPKEGEGIVTGDVVNTASRLQGAAPVNGIAVSEETYRATERVFDYEQLEPVAVKGKAEPLPLWRALQARARFGSRRDAHARDAARRAGAGEAASDRHVRARRPAALLPAGHDRRRAGGRQEPTVRGALRRTSTSAPSLSRWRQGRCLPYGEGIAFWALGEIVKAECGILESDSPSEAAAKLERALARRRPDRALAAGSARAAGRRAARSRAAQEESFTAWRRFLEALAAERPGRPRVRGPALGRPGAARVPRAPGRLVAGRAAARCSAPPGRSCTSAIRPGRRGCATRPRSTSRRSPTRRPPG